MNEVPSDPQAERFYGAAYERIGRVMLVLSGLGIVGLWGFLGWRVAAGYGAGCLIAYANFYWLKQIVVAIADRTVNTGRAASGAAVVARFFLRYLLIGLGAYVIFKSSVLSLNGLLAGLFLPVAAMMCEAGYELYVALRRGI